VRQRVFLKERLADSFSQCFKKCVRLTFSGISDALRDGGIIYSIRDLVTQECRFIQASQSKINQDWLGLTSFGFRDTTVRIELDACDHNRRRHERIR
jgi:hypothetical protein